MKKIFVTAFVCLLTLISSAQIKLSAYFDGYWSDWKICSSTLNLRGGYSSFIIYDKNKGPWDELFKVTIDNFYMPDPKTRKRNYKNNLWYEFTGTVEYYISDDYLTPYKVFKTNKGPGFVTSDRDDGRPTKKITSKAKIKIAPYKDHPTVYNIWYDNVGLGISLNNKSF